MALQRALCSSIRQARVDERTERLSEIAVRLRAAVKSAGGNAEVCRKTGIPKKTLGNYLSGKVEPTAIALGKIARACGVTTDWIVGGGPDDGGLDQAGDRINPSGTSAGDAISGSEIVTIRKLGFRASAGDGGTLVIDQSTTGAPFPQVILDRLGIRPAQARLLDAAGDSMRPTIEDGDPLLVDLGSTDIIEGKVYVFTIGDVVLVKRLRRRGSTLLMRSDNRDLYPDEEEVPTVEPVRIIGRVRWVGRSL